MSLPRRRLRTSTSRLSFGLRLQARPVSGAPWWASSICRERGVDHHTTVHEVGEGCVQAVCSCGWRSAAFGADKTTGTMDPLQQAVEAGDLHEWDASIS